MSNGENCTSSCRTRNHVTWGACVRAKDLRVAEVDSLQQKRADKNLDKYEKARRYGVQPATTRPHDVDQAVRVSETTSSAYQAI